MTEEVFDSQDLLEEMIELLNINIDCEINLPEENIEMHANKSALRANYSKSRGQQFKI